MKGRGTDYNPHNRFAPLTSEIDAEFAAPNANTQVSIETARSIISYNNSPDVPFERSINPYRGCEHGCIYCFARPTHAYLDLSPGLDFETKLFAKTNAAQVLRDELAKRNYQCVPITIGANTDGYQPIEKQYRLTRQILEVLWEHRHPCSIITKSQIICDDLTLLKKMAGENLVKVMISVTTLDDDLKRKLEPRAASGQARINTMAQLADAGIPVGVLASPMIPALNDSELETILTQAKQAGAESAGYILLRLPLEIAGLFENWLQEHYPLRAEHVMSLIRQSRDGANYDSTFHTRMRGTGVFADLLAARFKRAARALHLNEKKTELRTDLFKVPTAQISLDW
ncbi:MAG: Radical domain protein [Verrucomicrobiaceae bacterium]|nr:Radical domain protein [Verrucomicrobiaceae bacterium]